MDNLRGAALMVLSMACFALTDTFVKLLSTDLPPGEILAIMGVGGAAAMALILALRGEAPLTSEMLRGAVALRSAFDAAASLSFFFALSLIPLSLMTTILQANPLLVTLGAAVFLAEPVGWRRWTAIAIGLVGVLIVLRPWDEAFQLAALFAVAGVVFQSARDLSTRWVVARVNSLQISVTGFLALIPTGLLAMAVTGSPPAMPDGRAMLWIICMIGVAIPAYYSVVVAMRIGDVSFVAPFRYTRIVFGLLAGVLVFGETLDGYTLFGAMVIVASGLYTFLREARLRRRSLNESHGGV